MNRCSWCSDDEAYIAYHDGEWGRPQHDDVKLFELLTLEGMQAGLSWITILKKREAFRLAFCGFDAARVAAFGEEDIARLMADAGIVRSRRKIAAAIGNARAFMQVQRDAGSFDRFIWSYVDFSPIVNAPAPGNVPSSTELSERISRDLKARGFRFVGPTIVYSFMQAAGLVNDHEQDCALCGRRGEEVPSRTE